MKILVQDTITRRYFQSRESWTMKPHDGFDFEHVPEALRFCEENRLADVQVVVKLECGLPDWPLQFQLPDRPRVQMQ